jgi:hypothetical protein
MPTEPALRCAIELKNLASELEDATVEQIAEMVDLETGLPALLKALGTENQRYSGKKVSNQSRRTEPRRNAQNS